MAAPGKCIQVTGPPVSNLTVDAIHTLTLSFSHLIGKTTLMMRVLESLRASNPNLRIQGFYTREIRRGTERVGFEVVTVSGRSGPLASIDSKRVLLRQPTVGRYKVDVSSLESLALPELQIREDTDMFLIDEVGKMELFSSSFLPAVLRILNSNIPILASVPVANQGRDIPGVARVKNHPGAIIYMLNTNNRDAYQERIYSQMADLLQKK